MEDIGDRDLSPEDDDDGVTNEDLMNADSAAEIIGAVDAAETTNVSDAYEAIEVLVNVHKHLTLSIVDAQPGHYIVLLDSEPVLVVAGKQKLLTAIRKILEYKVEDFNADPQDVDYDED